FLVPPIHSYHLCYIWSFPYTLFFLFMIPPPPTSTLFPYTTLFRSWTCLGCRSTCSCAACPLTAHSSWTRRRPGTRRNSKNLTICSIGCFQKRTVRCFSSRNGPQCST